MNVNTNFLGGAGGTQNASNNGSGGKKFFGLGCAGIGCLGIVLLLLILLGWGIGVYNGLVTQQETVETNWGQVETQYQRRADLIPNLVNTVKGYAKHEQQTFEAVVKARAEATSLKIDASKMTPEQLKQYQAAQGDVTAALGKLLAVSEAYPDLKANEEFSKLQDQLEGTENRISVARKDFNEAAKNYNIKRRSFPAILIAGMMGFDEKPYFEAQAGADKAPTVNFEE